MPRRMAKQPHWSKNTDNRLRRGAESLSISRFKVGTWTTFSRSLERLVTTLPSPLGISFEPGSKLRFKATSHWRETKKPSIF